MRVACSTHLHLHAMLLSPTACTSQLSGLWWLSAALLVVYVTQNVAAATQVLCASDASHEKVDPVAAPEGVPNGERVMVSG